MNEVKKCSLSGIAFSMDIEAYNELQNYLTALKTNYKDSPDGAEIVADIEARIAELILSTQDNTRVVELPLVKNIIAQMGSPEDIRGEEEEQQAQPKHTPLDRNPRRLYRDLENAKLGGVCSGIARYFDVDPAWIRVAMFLPLIMSCFSHIPLFGWMGPLMGNLFGVFIICYVVMWFAVPVARTARQKLEMNGQPITAQNIASSAAANDPDAKAKAVVASTVSTAGQIALLLLKMFAGLIVFFLVLFACALLIGLFAIVVGGHELMPADIPMSVPVLAIFIPFIPTLLMIYVLMCLIASRHSNGKVLLFGVALWILSILLCAGIAIKHGVAPRAIDGYELKKEEIMQEEIEINGERITLEELVKQVEEDGAIDLNGDWTLPEGAHEAGKQKPLVKIETKDAKTKTSNNSAIKINVNESEKGADFTVEAGGEKLIEVKVNEQ
ncbi:MAG: PspC domain-containing protein [Alistipes sp.]|nr:PspC domain-containing protein [Alistipes sp.]